MLPPAGARVETVVRQQPPAVPGDEVHGGDDVVADGGRHHVVEGDPDPAVLDARTAAADLLPLRPRLGGGDAEQPVRVRPGARAAAAGLDPEQVVEHGDHELVVQVAVAVPDPEGHDGQSRGAAVAEDLQPRVVPPGRQHPPAGLLLAGLDQPGADGLLQPEDQAGADGTEDRRGAALLPGDRVGGIVVPARVHPGDGAAARHRGHRADQVPADHQHAGRAGTADELVRGQEDGVLLVPGPRRALGHPHRQVRPGRGEVPAGQRAVLVQQAGDRPGVGPDAGHVGGGREAADPQWTVRVPAQLRGQRPLVDRPVRGRRDHHHVRDRLPPGQLVGVVLVRSDQDDRPLLGRDPRGQAVPLVERGWQAQAEDAHELVDGGRAAGAAEDHQVVLGAADGVPDHPARVLDQPGGLPPGQRALAVGVAVAGQDMPADDVLDQVDRAAGGGVVGVRDPARPVRPDGHLVGADHPAPDPLQQRRGLLAVRLGHRGPPPARRVPPPRAAGQTRRHPHRDRRVLRYRLPPGEDPAGQRAAAGTARGHLAPAAPKRAYPARAAGPAAPTGYPQEPPGV